MRSTKSRKKQKARKQGNRHSKIIPKRSETEKQNKLALQFKLTDSSSHVLSFAYSCHLLQFPLLRSPSFSFSSPSTSIYASNSNSSPSPSPSPPPPSSSSSILFPHTTNSLRVRGIMVAGAKTRKAASIPVADCSSYSWSDQTINVELRLVHQTWPPNCKPVDAHVCLATTKVQYVRSRESTQQWPA